MRSGVGQILSMVMLDFPASPVYARDLMFTSHSIPFYSLPFLLTTFLF